MAKDIDALKASIIALRTERDGYVKTYQTLTDVYKTEGIPEAKRRASQALDEADKRSNEIARLEAVLANLGKGDNSS